MLRDISVCVQTAYLEMQSRYKSTKSRAIMEAEQIILDIFMNISHIVGF